MSTATLHLVEELIAHVSATSSLVGLNQKAGVQTHPIPFFGKLREARVITIGLNPSATEFAYNRWPITITPERLTQRLETYFDGDPHPWFERWEQGLNSFGVSYRSGAAHLDISPRATINTESLNDKNSFLRMMEADLPWMLRFLNLAKSVRMVLMAGAVNKTTYVNEFIARRLDPKVARLTGAFGRKPGRGNVCLHTFQTGNRSIPAWFCTSSPSDRRNPTLLIDRIRENADQLRVLSHMELSGELE